MKIAETNALESQKSIRVFKFRVFVLELKNYKAGIFIFVMVVVVAREGWRTAMGAGACTMVLL